MIKKILILLWKDLLKRKNHFLSSTIEVLLPIGLIILINWLVPKETNEVHNDQIWMGAYEEDKCVPKHSIFGGIIYEPSTPFIDKLIAKAACYAGYRKSDVHQGRLNDNSSQFGIGVKFDVESLDEDDVPSTLNYTLFPTNKAFVNVFTLWRYFGSAIPGYSSVFLFNLVELQRAIDTSFLHLKNISTKQIFMENTDLYGKAPRVYSLAIYFTLFVAISLMISPIVSRVVQEAYTGAKELMLMMGVTRLQIWIAKFLDNILFGVVTVSGMVVFLFVPLKEDSNYLKISPFLFWAVIMYGLISAIPFMFFLCCFFKKSNVAVYIIQIIWSFSFIFNNFISQLIQLPRFVKYFMCLLPHISLMEGVSILLNFDFYEKEIKLTERLSGKEDSMTLLDVLCMMTVNILLYGFLTWYLEQVKPGRFGVPQPYNFCFKKQYWFPTKVLVNTNNSNINASPANFESVPSNLQVGVSIQNISKVFKTLDKGIVTAVDDVSLNFYHSEISALLGHNGAGKTTVFSMITGLTCPTSGKIIINGYDLCESSSEARKSLGLCPQHDMLFDDLTAAQTLNFFGVIKGLSLTEARKESVNLIERLKLEKVKNTRSSKLSGGQKRKVSLAIALIGGSKVLILDEPTAGMDPEIRREIWEILLAYRETRTILLTTHFMEEADALCDRIAIMDHGKIKCYGSPMFLKKKFGKGYILNAVVPDLDKSKELVEYVKQFIPTAKFKSQNLKTLNFEISEDQVSVFPNFLSGLEEKQKKNEITSYCISLSTLEDVFLRLRSGRKDSDCFDGVNSPDKSLKETKGTLTTPWGLLLLTQFWALLVKKWILFLRSYKSFLLYSILPALFVILSEVLSESNNFPGQGTKQTDQKSLPYSLSLYPSSIVLYSNLHDTNEKEIFRSLVENSASKVLEVNDLKNATREIFEDDFYTYARKLILAVDFDYKKTEFHVLHNDYAVHMIPISLNFIHNILLKSRYRNNTIVTSVDVRYASKKVITPLPLPRKCMVADIPNFGFSQTMFYLLAPLKERLFGSKEIQLMNVPGSFYWFSHILVDALTYFVYIALVYFGLGFSFDDQFMIQNAVEILAGFLFCGSGLILINYVISTVQKDAASGFSVTVTVYALFTFVIYNVIYFHGLPNYFQYTHPSCILKFGLNDLCFGRQSNFVLALFLYNCVIFIFLVLKDSKLLSQIIHGMLNRFIRVDYSLQEAKDEYVKQEEEVVKDLIEKDKVSSSALLVDELKRWYLKSFLPKVKASPAVRGISFSVKKGECFGLLGVNGAGKTSTFKILTGALPASHGRAFACSEQLNFFNRRKYLSSIGYCRQFGGLLPNFKGRELLTFFARLRGVHRSCVEEEVNKWLEKMNLLEYANQKCGTYSGGNQRKLCTAIALIGECPLIFLDEPTTGVDPLSRRSIWDVIGNIQKEGRSVVLTSHSMDECEALCSRLAIMVNGRFRCIGETTTLKDRFGQGYCVYLKLSNQATENFVQSLKEAVAAAFEPGCELVDEHLTVLQYHVTNKSISWADLFLQLNGFKEKFSILESYTASATTLEQIFIYFARIASEEV